MAQAPDIAAALPMVRALARKFSNTPLGRDDAFGHGCIALVKAARRYDPSRGVEFPVFAMRRVYGEMQEAARHTNGTRAHNSKDVLVEDAFDWGATHDRYLTKESILGSLAGLTWEDRHVALLVAAGYKTGEIARAWGVADPCISARLRRIRQHLAEAAA